MTARFDDPDTVQKHVGKMKRFAQNMCNSKILKKRLPILQWLPTYTFAKFIQDMIAGVTVGLTAIPQGMAYATVAGLPPEYGLYSGLTGGVVYMIFGGCKDVSIGSTAIMSALVARYISGHNSDFAVLAAFLAGSIELTMGLFHLGFLVQYISKPVIIGFTNAAALQIISSQIKTLLGHTGPSGNYFAESMKSFVIHVSTSNIWDAILGLFTIFTLVAMQRIGGGSRKTKSIYSQFRWYISLSRNAVVVIVGLILAFILKVTNVGEPLTVIGEIKSGLPKIQMPPFNTVVGNETYTFVDIIQTLGPQSLIVPVVAILEIVAIASAFSSGVSIDASQEMIALGLCNIVGSFTSSMPITSSFSRGALNRASGAQTPAGGIFTACLIVLALSLLTSTFYFIPKATLAAMIMTAMYSMMNFTIFGKLWRKNKAELFVVLVTMIICLWLGLEFGIVAGVLIQALMLLYSNSKPSVEVTSVRNPNGDVIVVILSDRLSYCAADHVRRKILEASSFATNNSLIVLEGNHLKRMDYTVATQVMSVCNDLEKKQFKVLFLNFNQNVKNMCVDVGLVSEEKFVTGTNSGELVNKLIATTDLTLSIDCITKTQL